MDFLVPVKLFLALIIGVIIGLERESRDSHEKAIIKQGGEKEFHSAGIRTFSLISTLGAVSAFLLKDYLPFSIIITSSFFLLMISYYVINSLITKDFGITTELAIIFTFILGFLVATEIFPLQIIFAITIILALILSKKESVTTIIKSIQREEINAFISYALIAVVILPFLPNQSYSLSDIPGFVSLLSTYGIQAGDLSKIELVNPFSLWFIIAIITGVDMAGYVLERTIGKKKGVLLASMVGGFISSTATTQSLAQESKTGKNTNSLVASAVFANLVSYFSLFILMASINGPYLVKVTPVWLSTIFGAFLVGLFFLLKKGKTDNEEKSLKTEKEIEIFAMIPAIKFALLFLTIKIVSQIALLYFGQSGFYIASAIASLTGTDAAIINVSTLVGKTISLETAILAFILISTVNLMAKSFYSFIQGKREFAYKFGVSMAIVIIFSFIGLLFV